MFKHYWVKSFITIIVFCLIFTASFSMSLNEKAYAIPAEEEVYDPYEEEDYWDDNTDLLRGTEVPVKKIYQAMIQYNISTGGTKYKGSGECWGYAEKIRKLFGGGTGTLKINDDEDILEAGININAQPPGKKLQNMLMLSGGEKALAAIALLFAIQNLKPSPFCLLDEIEAALDESNVGRFAGYLGKLTEHTQFIVITHRRGTMEKADRLYGITMQEKGVSALVSVNLIDKELDD